jgi:hypothetical protein
MKQAEADGGARQFLLLIGMWGCRAPNIENGAFCTNAICFCWLFSGCFGAFCTNEEKE